MSFFDIFKPAPVIDPIEDAAVVKKKYRYWRLRVFYGMYVGYAFYYFSRKSFTFAMPAMMTSLGFDKSELGILASILSLSYGISKFVSGIAADRSNPRYFMSIGLILTGIFNILFGFSSTILFFAIFWALNGWFQGWGWPPCARLLSHWYSQQERGRWWGVWNTSHNLGGALIPILVAFCAERYGWRYAMYVPGILCILVGFFLMNRLRDTPGSLGLPTVEKFRGDHPHVAEKLAEEKPRSAKEVLVKYVLKNPYIWLLAFSYFFVYVIRTGINDWGQFYLYEEKGYSLISASTCIFAFEIGGFVGSLVAGWFSDIVFKGRRGPVNLLFCLGVILALVAFWYAPVAKLYVVFFIMFAIGFFIFGPQMLIGMAAAELSHKDAAGTATGFAGWFAYLGAASAGYPIGKVVDVYGWKGFFIIVVVCAIISVLILLPMWKIKVNPRFHQTP